MIAVVCTLLPFGCCIQIYHYTTATSFSLFVQDVVCTVSGGGGGMQVPILYTGLVVRVLSVPCVMSTCASVGMGQEN
jgi:hypothetical protein